ncbi:hypothetical protein AB0870_03040 [Microbacterium proteolyticum]|uniref:hypothetical protein n=1 Tax=Microbacterium TaxID=33882 RepID=UPI0009F958EE|nr:MULTISPECIES: hypothetical protein [Microbacterium]MDI9891848.1 hypothetical protein [Microbacterium sp. IEGM 1404]MXS76078.1 hypothetical protein [Microbacterium sp. TL13]
MTTALPGVATAAPGGGVSVQTHGRVDVADRVFRKAAEQAAAEAIGVDRADVSVDIAASRDTVVVRVQAPFPVPRLDDTEAVRAATPVLEAARGIQHDLHDRLTRLFGRKVSRVDLTIAGATTPKRRRVR